MRKSVKKIVLDLDFIAYDLEKYTITLLFIFISEKIASELNKSETLTINIGLMDI